MAWNTWDKILVNQLKHFGRRGEPGSFADLFKGAAAEIERLGKEVERLQATMEHKQLPVESGIDWDMDEQA